MHDQHEPTDGRYHWFTIWHDRSVLWAPTYRDAERAARIVGVQGPYWDGPGVAPDPSGLTRTRIGQAGPPASTDAVSPDERARGTSQAADTTAEAARALGLTPRPIP